MYPFPLVTEKRIPRHVFILYVVKKMLTYPTESANGNFPRELKSNHFFQELLIYPFNFSQRKKLIKGIIQRKLFNFLQLQTHLTSILWKLNAKLIKKILEKKKRKLFSNIYEVLFIYLLYQTEQSVFRKTFFTRKFFNEIQHKILQLLYLVYFSLAIILSLLVRASFK